MTTTAVALQQDTGYQLVATDKTQMEAAHGRMIEWARSKQDACDVDMREESENLAIAEERHWATATFKRRIALLKRRRVFYEKIEIALQAGYVIVPNFAMNVFAIRTDADAPKNAVSTSSWESFPQQPKLLPEGEGDYQNPLPTVSVSAPYSVENSRGDKVTQRDFTPEEWAELEFPIALAKPVLMSKTATAMGMKLFDEIGVAVDSGSNIARGKGDPIIIGRLRNPRPNAPAISFFIGWYFDPTNI